MRRFPIAVSMILFSLGAAAQPAVPGPTGDPPALVGRLARVQGTVSQHGAGADRWEPAIPNFPIASGSAVWTEPSAQAEVEAAGSRLVLGGGTELDVDRLDGAEMQATLPRGELYLHLAGLAGAVELRTPRGTARVASPGRYGLAAGDTDHPTVLTVTEGSASFTGIGVQLQAAPGQAVTVAGADPLQGSVGAAEPDAFLTAQLARERPARQQAAVPPQAVRGMTGSDDLEQYGRWQSVPEYGTVWYPDAGPDYVPYRQGRWAWMAPWGWTWVDDAPWGFAPSHYGRWVRVADRWAWAPVLPAAPAGAVPVYAPAVVSFVDVAGVALAGAGVGYAVGPGRPRPVGWVPLGWQEPYVPSYRASPRYRRQINATNVSDVSAVGVQSFHGRGFANRAAATVIPGEAMVRFQPVAPAARPLPAEIVLRPVLGRPALPPATTTAGLTPAVARQFRLAQPAFPPAPGPALQGQSGPPGGGTAIRAGVPSLPGLVRPEYPHPSTGLPPLRTPMGAGSGLARAGGGAIPPEMRPEIGRPGPIAPHRPPGAAPGQASPDRPMMVGPGLQTERRSMQEPRHERAGFADRGPAVIARPTPPQVARPVAPMAVPHPVGPAPMPHPAAEMQRPTPMVRPEAPHSRERRP